MRSQKIVPRFATGQLADFRPLARAIFARARGPVRLSHGFGSGFGFGGFEELSDDSVCANVGEAVDDIVWAIVGEVVDGLVEEEVVDDNICAIVGEAVDGIVAGIVL